MTTRELFETETTAVLAVERWQLSLSRSLDEATMSVQRSMWGSFATWCLQQGIDAATLQANELHAYLRSREGSAAASELTPRYAWRLVRLIGLVVNHLAKERGHGFNMAASDLLKGDRTLRLANDPSTDPLPECLSDSEDRLLVSFLEASVPRAGRDLGMRWQDLRNRAAVALHRGAGLTPLEVRKLQICDLYVDPDPKRSVWKVRAPTTGSIKSHDAPVARWARPLLVAWLAVRRERSISGDWLFPSTRTGKQLGKTTHFDGCAEVLQATGLTDLVATGGGYRLRNTFALRQLAKRPGCDAEVAAWLGITVTEIARYHRVLSGPVEVF